MELSPTGIQMLTGLEGACCTVYKDQRGLPTIGVGHLLTASELSSGLINIDGVLLPWADGLTPDQVDRLLERDTAQAAAAVTTLVTVTLTQPQFDALVSFVFNIGAGAFRTSTLLHLLNQGAYDDVPIQMREWIKGHVNGQFIVIQDLVERRETEIARWNSPA